MTARMRELRATTGWRVMIDRHGGILLQYLPTGQKIHLDPGADSMAFQSHFGDQERLAGMPESRFVFLVSAFRNHMDKTSSEAIRAVRGM